jgi:hypothetical protein
MAQFFFHLLVVMAVSQSGFAKECEMSQQRAEKLRKDGENFKAPTPATSSAVDGQAKPQSHANANAINGVNAATTCLNVGGKIQDEIEEELKKIKGKDECAGQERLATKGLSAIQSTLAQCQSTKGQLESQAGKTGGNEKKMGGDDKKKDGQGGGGEGGMPQIPQLPQQDKKKKKDNSGEMQRIKEELKACKERVEGKLTTKKSDCERGEYAYLPSAPVQSQLKKQDECKQTAIFDSQRETAKCESASDEALAKLAQ